VKGLLVVQRLSEPAVLPGVRGVIAARRPLFVMPWCRWAGYSAAAPGRGDRRGGHCGGRAAARDGQGEGSRGGLPRVRDRVRPGPQPL